MIRIAFPADRAVNDMAAVAQKLGVSVNGLDDGIYIGSVSQWLDVGEGDEDNKPHHMFASVKLGIRIEVDEHGAVLFSTRLKPHSGGVFSRSCAWFASFEQVQERPPFGHDDEASAAHYAIGPGDWPKLTLGDLARRLLARRSLRQRNKASRAVTGVVIRTGRWWSCSRMSSVFSLRNAHQEVRT